MINNVKFRSRPISILLLVSIIIELFGSINYLLINVNGEIALVETLFFIGFIISVRLLFLDQSIVKSMEVDTIKLWTFEFLNIVSLIF